VIKTVRILILALALAMPLNALSPQAQERLKTSLIPDFAKLSEIPLSPQDKEKLILSVDSIGKITAEVVAEDTTETVLASESVRRTALERKVRAWEGSIPWLITGGALAFVGGLVVGLNVKP
jgi:hypothetical protein